jgi:hypothetical protein
MIAQSVPEAGQIRPIFSADGPSGRTQVIYQEGVVMDRHEPDAELPLRPQLHDQSAGAKSVA